MVKSTLIQMCSFFFKQFVLEIFLFIGAFRDYVRIIPCC